MFGWFKRKQESENQTPGTPGLMRAVASTAIDRRQHPRVRYPQAGLERLPRIVSERGLIFPADISLGGMLLRNPPISKPKVGAHFALKTYWPQSNIEMCFEAELLRVHGESWHFKFNTVDSRYFIEFPKSLKAGLRGYGLRQFDSHEIPKGQNIQELWLSENGDLVMFQQIDPTQPYIVTISCGSYRIQFDSKKCLLGAKRQVGQWDFERSAPLEAIEDIIFMLANIRNPSLKVAKLINDILNSHFSPSKVA